MEFVTNNNGTHFLIKDVWKYLFNPVSYAGFI